MLFWDVHCLERRRRVEIGNNRRLKVWWRARGTYGFIYRPGKTSRGLKSWLWIVAHVPRKSEGGKVSLTSPPMGRLEF
jgi:hypothetical protein